jgi:hypothetical protein
MKIDQKRLLFCKWHTAAAGAHPTTVKKLYGAAAAQQCWLQSLT